MLTSMDGVIFRSLNPPEIIALEPRLYDASSPLFSTSVLSTPTSSASCISFAEDFWGIKPLRKLCRHQLLKMMMILSVLILCFLFRFLFLFFSWKIVIFFLLIDDDTGELIKCVSLVWRIFGSFVYVCYSFCI